MKITKIEPAKKSDRFNIYVDDEFLFNINYETIVFFNLSKQMQLNNEKIQEITDYDRVKRAKNKAYDLLCRNDYTKKGLQKKLIEKGIDKALAEEAAQNAADKGVLSDERYAQQKAQYLYEYKRFGRRRIINELLHKGIEKELAEEVADSFDFPSERVRELASKLLGSIPPEPKAIKKIYDKLIYLGYNYDEASTALREVKEDDYI